MKNYYSITKSKILLLLVFLFSNTQIFAQSFWADSFTVNNWTLNVSTGLQDPDANVFFVSDDEGGGIAPNLGAPASCGVATNGNNTLHITPSATITGGGSIGAAYLSGGLCGFGICATTNKRAESPTINCTGKSNISVNFNYIENGDGLIDNATLWYYDGTTWSQISDMPKTLTGCGGQGLWTSHVASLPASANNNANVKIAFRWVNNDDGIGTDPSFAVDNIVLCNNTCHSIDIVSGIGAICPCASFNLFYTSIGVFAAGNIYNVEMSDAFGNFTSPTIIGSLASTANSGNISCTVPCAVSSFGNYLIRISSSSPSAISNFVMLPIASSVPVIITTLPNDTVCAGTMVTLDAVNLTNPVWAGPGITGNNVPFQVSTTTTYTVSGVDACGMMISSTTTIYIETLATVTATSTNVCAGNSVTLNATGTNISWTGGITNNVAFVPTATNTYTATATSANGCILSNSITVNVNPLPVTTIIASPNDTICAGTALTLSGQGATTYSWNNGISNATSFVPTSNNTYIVTGTANGCSSTAAIAIVVLNKPTVTATATSNGIICAGLPITLNGGGANTYTWNGGITNGVAFNPTTGGSYVVTGTGANGCTNTTSIAITVNPKPQIGVIVAPFDTICQGQSVTISGTGGSNYTISGGVTNGVAFAPTATNSYTITGTGANGCTNTYVATIAVLPNNVLSFNITSNPSVILVGVPNVITANIPANITNYTLQWFRANVLVATNMYPNNTYSYTPSNINDNVYAVLIGGTCSTPNQVTSNKLNVSFAEGIAEMEIPNNFQIYPNPTQSNISINGLQVKDAIVITDAIGKIIYTSNITNTNTLNINLNNFANGIYLASFNRDGKKWFVKIVKE